MSTVKNLLDRKGNQVWSITPEASVLDATQEMNRHRIGALLVMDDEHVLGIFTERDILMRVIASDKNPADIRVCDVMSTPVAYCTADTPVEVCKAIFTEKRIRHLPVMASDRPIGVVTTGDVMAYATDSLQATVRYLEAYICES